MIITIGYIGVSGVRTHKNTVGGEEGNSTEPHKLQLIVVLTVRGFWTKTRIGEAQLYAKPAIITRGLSAASGLECHCPVSGLSPTPCKTSWPSNLLATTNAKALSENYLYLVLVWPQRSSRQEAGVSVSVFYLPADIL